MDPEDELAQVIENISELLDYIGSNDFSEAEYTCDLITNRIAAVKALIETRKASSEE